MDSNNTSYTPLPGEDPSAAVPPPTHRRPLKVFAVTFSSVIFLLSLVTLIIHQGPGAPPKTVPEQPDHDHRHQQPAASTSPEPRSFSVPRGKLEGVSAKSSPYFSEEASYNWTNAMFSWQRTAFHFQPEHNWMNDPDGPLFYKGWYHLFYQYNPDSAVWGNITWGHAVSTDMIHWLYLPLAMVPDRWYDANGVWTGSATILPNGEIMILYTGSTNDSVQVQNLAYPANLSDPLLLDWIKYKGNPVLTPPSGIGSTDFRDPTTAWIGPDGKWRITIGSKINTTGISMVYTTTDFINYELHDGVLHEVPGTGMWECVDFYPVSINGTKGVETSVNNDGVKHVLKASLDDTKLDHYAIGTYFIENETWVPDDPTIDVGIGLRYDYGRYYASKTFYDQNKERRILWGWINETDTATDDLEKGWSSLQTIPRTVLFDSKTGTNLLQWPVEEIEDLRLNSTEFTDVLVEAGTTVPLDIGTATQLDILVDFEIELLGTEESVNGSSGCGDGAADRSTFGPFGILALADETLSEFTPVYFRVTNSTDGDVTTYFCADELRSSRAPEVFKQVYGGEVPVLDGETYSARVLVDHSILESYAQGGRTVISSRVYPTEAIYGAARLFLFNNATGMNVKATLKIWQLNSAFIHPFPLDQV
ncbi:acid beta-fructofuranosidase 1, vacuolar-like [Malus sylvestris]|uniref:acid beta-fructofuranosidase 1, vacuolar-like n=1 Tax=Malus sylvestris TaxID=3752 RepID=UPI0010A9E059|nr:acid beta-fructofuranosidase 1, vacuolar-like [Malus domestica]XP_050155158.1 acid beta-fructofuranosidase 1, vacuolar-like [Malus sylvestris]